MCWGLAGRSRGWPWSSPLQQIRDGGDPMLSQDQGLGGSRRCGAMRQKMQGGGVTSCWGKRGHPPPPLQMLPNAPANRPDLRTGGAQDSKHTAKLFDVILSWEKGGPVQQLPQDAAHGPAGTEAKHLRDLTLGTQVSTHQHPQLPLRSRHPQSSLQIPSFTPSKASSLEYRAQLLLSIGLRPQL